jgi:uncharacterized protein
MTHLFYFPLFFLWRCGGMMLIGMALFKWGFLDGSLPVRTYAIAAVLCLASGLGLAALGVRELERVRFAMPERTIPDLWNYTGSVLASTGYAAALILLVKSGALTGLRRSLAAVGQMAFSNYLFHSIVTAIIFLGWGLGYAGRADYAQQLAVVVAIWLFQLAVSPWWLSRFRFGPAEWVWRSLTYWQRQPMLRNASPRHATV